MNSKIKIVFAAGALAGSLTIGMLIGTTINQTAAAQGGPNPTPTAVAPGGPGSGFGRGMMGGRGQMGGAAWGGEMTLDTVAPLLGMTEEQIVAERQSGKSLAQIAQAKGVSKENLVNAIVNAKVTAVNQLVRDGKLTQAQADLIIQNMRTQVPLAVDRTEVGPGEGRGGCGVGAGANGQNGQSGQPGSTFGPRGGRGMMGGFGATAPTRSN